VKDCLFCTIASGAMGVPFVHEDADFVAFRDIAPAAPSHVLVVPRKHLDSLAALADEPADFAGRFVHALVAVARGEGLDDPERGFRVVANTGPEGGQSVPHLHGHVLGGRRLSWPPG
jgi:histidine triad (HIT) family protein